MNLLPKKNPTTVNIGENVAYIEKELARDTESNIRVEIIVNGNCMLCGKPLSGNRLFLCEECSKKGADKPKESEVE